ncbi:hypothetical protein [Streptomyces sp. NPDC001250]
MHDLGFHPSFLAYFRRRLAGSAQPDRLFDAVRVRWWTPPVR